MMALTNCLQHTHTHSEDTKRTAHSKPLHKTGLLAWFRNRLHEKNWTKKMGLHSTRETFTVVQLNG